MFDPDQFHDPEFRSLVRATRAVIAERVHRGVASPPERLAVAALDEMPDEDDPAAVRAWAPSAAFRDAVRSVVLATLALYLGIVESLADEADREGRRRRRRDDALTTWWPLAAAPWASEVLRHRPPLGRRPGRVVRHHPRGLPVPGQHHVGRRRPPPRQLRRQPDTSRVGGYPRLDARRPRRRLGTAAPPSAARAARPGPRATGSRRTAASGARGRRRPSQTARPSSRPPGSSCRGGPSPASRRRRQTRRLVDPPEGAHLAPPQPRHEEQPRDHRVEAAALQDDLV